MKKLSIGLVHLLNSNKKFSLNKDINGGAGTADDYDGSIGARILSRIRKKTLHYPILSLAYLQAILKNQGHKVNYYELNSIMKISECHDLLIIYGTIVDYKHESESGRIYKKKYTSSRVGFIGPFPSVRPDLFATADFVIKGEVEGFFMDQFISIDQLKGIVNVNKITEINNLPQPDLEGYPLEKYSYGPAFKKRPFFFLISSKGCPYSCSYYCTYGEYQGPIIRQRSPSNIAKDMLHLKERYGIQSIQFRDPTFGMKKGIIYDICNELEIKKR